MGDRKADLSYLQGLCRILVNTPVDHTPNGGFQMATDSIGVTHWGMFIGEVWKLIADALATHDPEPAVQHVPLPSGVVLPKHINLTIEHQPQASNYESVGQWLKGAENVTQVDPDEMVRTGEVWLVQWYPRTPIGFCWVAASTLEKALAAACE